MRAQLEGVDGEVSAPARFETLAALPGAPRSLRLVARADRTVTLEWSAPAEQCGPLAPLRAYALEYAERRERRPASAASSASAANVCLTPLSYSYSYIHVFIYSYILSYSYSYILLRHRIWRRVCASGAEPINL